jgi:hypothetical protein
MIIDKPRLIGQTRGLDFGAGFYLTSSAAQAEHFSEIVCKRRGDGTPTVSIYTFDEVGAQKHLSVRRFDRADADWLHFVIENRLQTYRGPAYDLVIGAVANDNVMPTLQALLGGFLTEEAALVALKTKKLVDQYCFRSEQALALLSYQENKQWEAN